MKVTLVVPEIGRREEKRYLRTWQMEPLVIATLAGITPADIELKFFDERIEEINFEDSTDLVAITSETYNAKRAYEISEEYHKRGVPVVLGGYHPTLLPNEAVQYADSIVVGPAENIWAGVLRDAEKNQLKRIYNRPQNLPMQFGTPKRSLFAGKPYFGVGCMETSRGCPLSCTYCSITTVNGGGFFRKPVPQLIDEIQKMNRKYIFFVDDNVIGNIRSAKEMLKAIIPLKIRWFSQGTINMTWDEDFLDLMAESGCMGVLIGFESLKKETLALMDKKVNIKAGDYEKAIERLHKRGIGIYGAFIVGYDTDDVFDYEKTVKMAIQNKFFMGAFNHLVPFPGTKLYEQLRLQGRMRYEQWWLNPNFRFGEIPFQPENMTWQELKSIAIECRRSFYSVPSILRRFWNPSVTLRSPRIAATYFFLNFLLRQEILKRQGFPLGKKGEKPEPIFKYEPTEPVPFVT